MESVNEGCLDDLMSTEFLTAFSVVEYYCDTCDRLTPHHIDESKQQSISSSESTTFVPPMSVHECVVCREEEESMIDEDSL